MVRAKLFAIRPASANVRCRCERLRILMLQMLQAFSRLVACARCALTFCRAWAVLVEASGRRGPGPTARLLGAES